MIAEAWLLILRVGGGSYLPIVRGLSGAASHRFSPIRIFATNAFSDGWEDGLYWESKKIYLSSNVLNLHLEANLYDMDV
jgi:hypothetical protein